MHQTIILNGGGSVVGFILFMWEIIEGIVYTNNRNEIKRKKIHIL